MKLDEYISLLQITPNETWSKGQTRFIGNLNNCESYNNSGFIYAPIHKTVGEVEDKLEYLLNELIPLKDTIKELEKVPELEIRIAYYGYKDEMWGINLKPHTIQMLSDIGVSLDIDIYASGNDLP